MRALASIIALCLSISTCACGGGISVSNTAEPFISRLIASGEVEIWRPTSEVNPYHPISVLLYGASLLDERPEAGERFAAAVLRALRQFRGGKTPGTWPRGSSIGSSPPTSWSTAGSLITPTTC